MKPKQILAKNKYIKETTFIIYISHTSSQAVDLSFGTNFHLRSIVKPFNLVIRTTSLLTPFHQLYTP